MNKNLNQVLEGKTLGSLEMDELRGIINMSFVDKNGKETIVRITSKCGEPYLRVLNEVETGKFPNSFVAVSGSAVSKINL